jgi:hypothetical protein
MEISHVAEILRDGKSRGSGYLITPRHVLTARHVLKPGDLGTRCMVHPLHGTREQAQEPRPPPIHAQVGWVSTRHDLAVVEITGGFWGSADAGPIPFGEVPDNVVPQILGSGFPEAAGADQRTIIGTLTWVLTSRRFDIDVISAAPGDWTKWGGFSGTAIFADNLLVGVVRTVDKNWSGRVLEATPSTCLLDDISFEKYLKDAGYPLPKRLSASTMDHAMPLDFEANVSVDGSLRFSPHNPRIPFFGRGPELEALDKFLTSEPREVFTWWLMVGGGGAGKTRLARELCLRSRRQGWRAGFLPSRFEAENKSLDAWYPQTPTLIVADYVMTRVKEIRTLAARLARRRDGLPPLRLLMLEREAGEFFNQEFLGSTQFDRGVIERARHERSPLVLKELAHDQIWDLVEPCPWRPDARVNVARADFFDRLAELDSQRRPLIAMILADALATSAGQASLGGLEQELRDLLSRDRDQFWPAELGVAGHSIGDVEADVAIAFATMVDGLHVQELKQINGKRGRPLSPKWLPLCSQAVGKPINDQQLRRLEPDLIGEFFTLETLSYAYADPPHDWMPETAWRLRGSAMADFVTRARQNFPLHPAIEKVAITVEGVQDSWSLAARDAVTERFVHNNPMPGLSKAIRTLWAPAHSDIAAARAFAEMAFWAASLDPQLIGASTICDLLGALLELCKRHATDSSLRSDWAQAVESFVSQHTDPYRFLERGEVPNIIYHDIAKLLELCLSELDLLFQVAEEYNDEPELRKRFATGVLSFALDSKEQKSSECSALLDRLAGLCEKYNNELSLRDSWAKCVINFVRHRGSHSPAICYRLINDLAKLSSQHTHEPVLRTEFARSVTNFMHQRANMPPAGRALCPTLLGKLRDLYRAHLDELSLRSEWAWSVERYIFGAVGDEPGYCLELLDELTTLIDSYPSEKPLRRPWARAVANFVRCRSANEPVICAALVDKLAALSGIHPDEAMLHAVWKRARQALRTKPRGVWKPRRSMASRTT